MKKCTTIVFPNVSAMMSGVSICRRYVDHVELEYVDGSKERAPLVDGRHIDWENSFSIAGYVQDFRKSAA